MTNPFAPSSQEFSWVDSTLQEPMLASKAQSSYEPKDVSNACELCCETYFIQCTSWMLRFPLNYIGLCLYVALTIFYTLLVCDVVDVGDWFPDSTENAPPRQEQATYVCLQTLSAGLTYAAVGSLPVLVRDWVRLVKSRLAGVVDGQEWSGGVTPSSDPFDYVPWRHRFAILLLFLTSGVLALYNQVAQVTNLHWDGETKQHHGWKEEFLTHVYLLGSILVALVGKVYQFWMQRQVRLEGKGPTSDEGETSVNMEDGSVNQDSVMFEG